MPLVTRETFNFWCMLINHCAVGHGGTVNVCLSSAPLPSGPTSAAHSPTALASTPSALASSSAEKTRKFNTLE